MLASVKRSTHRVTMVLNGSSWLHHYRYPLANMKNTSFYSLNRHETGVQHNSSRWAPFLYPCTTVMYVIYTTHQTFGILFLLLPYNNTLSTFKWYFVCICVPGNTWQRYGYYGYITCFWCGISNTFNDCHDFERLRKIFLKYLYSYQKTLKCLWNSFFGELPNFYPDFHQTHSYDQNWNLFC